MPLDPATIMSSAEDAMASAQNAIKNATPEFGKRLVPGVGFGATPPGRPPLVTNIVDVNGKKMGKDLRVKLRVPPNYFTSRTSGLENEIPTLGGIIFPYTPTISLEWKADYTTQSPLHSNFPVNFYQRSSVSSISISGKFTVETDKDAAMLLATMHLLKALTKMRSGGKTGDSDSGAPPPVCRLDAHGEWMFDNVPVAVTSFKVDLPDGVDYYTMPSNKAFGITSVPTVSTISITLLPMYSRAEMQSFNVTSFLNGNSGYL